jgi:hypothetical protein
MHQTLRFAQGCRLVKMNKLVVSPKFLEPAMSLTKGEYGVAGRGWL